MYGIDTPAAAGHRAAPAPGLMPVSADYVVRETASNLWRNRLMTVAAVLTVAVSLALVGRPCCSARARPTPRSSGSGGPR